MTWARTPCSAVLMDVGVSLCVFVLFVKFITTAVLMDVGVSLCVFVLFVKFNFPGGNISLMFETCL